MIGGGVRVRKIRALFSSLIASPHPPLVELRHTSVPATFAVIFKENPCDQFEASNY